MTILKRERLVNLVGAAAAALVAILFLFYRLELWSYPMGVPLGFQGDGLVPLMLTKTINSHGWFIVDSSLGAPGFLNLADYPITSDSFNLLIMKIMGWFLPDHFYVVNWFFVLRFPVTAAVAFACIRALGVRLSLAIALGVLYAFVPHNLIRGQGHLFIGTYFVLPPLILLLVKLARQDEVWSLKSRRLWAWTLFCVCLAASGVYFAFFGCFLFVCVGILNLVKGARRMVQAVWPPVYFCGVVTVTTILLTLPSILYWYREGRNPEMTGRLAWESELYGLKIIQLVLPISNHVLATFRRYTHTYNASAPLVTENTMACIGLLASIGFAFLLLYALVQAGGFRLTSSRADIRQSQSDFGALSYMTLCSVLLGTIGGLGTIFNYAVFSDIRAYNRISIFIAFFGIAALGLVLERLFSSNKFLNSRFMWVFVASLMGAGLYDQTGLIGLPWAAQIKAFEVEKRFSKQIEASLPAGARVFQLPIVPFPESPAVGTMIDYEHLKQPLLTKGLNWSYPSMRGRAPFNWQKEVSELATDDFLYRVWDRDFKAVYLDLHGYSDRGASIIKKLTSLLGPAKGISEDGRRVFFLVNLPIRVRYSEQGLPISIERLSQERVTFLPKLLQNPGLLRRLNSPTFSELTLNPKTDFNGMK
jgi:hypothetical protein